MKCVNIRIRLLYKYSTFRQIAIIWNIYLKWIYCTLKIDDYEVVEYIEERISIEI